MIWVLFVSELGFLITGLNEISLVLPEDTYSHISLCSTSRLARAHHHLTMNGIATCSAPLARDILSLDHAGDGAERTAV